jgi:two-component system response regulator FlrC
LNVFPLHLPPLRQRRADILPLARRVLAQLAQSEGRAVPLLSVDAECRLMDYPWPGNVRELDNVIQRALILQRGNTVTVEDLQFEGDAALCQDGEATLLDTRVASPEEPAVGRSVLEADRRGREQQIIVETLRSLGGSRRAAAERLGISERTLRYKLAKLREAGVELPR